MIQEIIQISKKAGKEIMRIYNTDFGVEFKEDNSPLTEADTAAHNIIKKELEKYNLPILSEEGKQLSYETRKDWNKFWLVDPIDGTKDFVKRTGDFTVNIALIENQTPVLGVVYVPAKDVTYYADETGAYKQEQNSKPQKIQAREIPEKEIIVVASRNHLNEETKHFIEEKRKTHDVHLTSVGSSIKLCLVAEGKADIYPRLGPTSEWDTAAANAVVLKAGAHVYQYNTAKELQYNKEDLLNPFFIVKK